jgi:hypothetical protein
VRYTRKQLLCTGIQSYFLGLTIVIIGRTGWFLRIECHILLCTGSSKPDDNDDDDNNDDDEDVDVIAYISMYVVTYIKLK